jgi:hypothetical protein
MAIGIDRARLQGTILSGRSVSANIYGAGVYDGTFGTGYSAKRERKVVQGSRRDLLPIGLTAGVYTPGAFTLKVSETTADMIRSGLAQTYDTNNGTSYGDAIFTCTIALYEPSAVNSGDNGVILYTFNNCAITDEKSDWPNTAEELIVEFGIIYTEADENGNSLWSSQQ